MSSLVTFSNSTSSHHTSKFHKFTLVKLREICRIQGLPVSGLKADVVRRLDIHFNVGGGVELDRLITEIIQRFASMTDRRRGRIVNNITQNNGPEIEVMDDLPGSIPLSQEYDNVSNDSDQDLY